MDLTSKHRSIFDDSRQWFKEIDGIKKPSKEKKPFCISLLASRQCHGLGKRDLVVPLLPAPQARPFTFVEVTGRSDMRQ